MGLRRGIGLLIRVIVVAVLAGASAVRAGEPPAGPILRIETGMHGAGINRIALTPDGGQIVSVSDDKTARLWSLDGTPGAVLRPPVGSGDEGALYAVAVSDSLIAVGGQTGLEWNRAGAVYLFNRDSGRPARSPAPRTGRCCASG